MKRHRLLAFILTLLISVFVVAQEPVYFADANLKAAVETRLGITNPTPADMLRLTSLQANGNGISDLTGLDYATNLRNLRLWRNQISDISPLSGLTSIQKLKLSENQISDILALSGLVSLQELGLSINQISDISPLNELSGLEWLGISYNQISDISPLSNLTGLVGLYLSGNQISDISSLSGLTNLEHLEIRSNQISDISSLSGLTRLGVLHLNNNQINDISTLSELTGLYSLFLYNNQISDISPLSGLTRLLWLQLQNNYISDISALSGLTRLQDLLLRDNQISDVSPLSGLISLEELRLESNRISDISTLVALTGLETLYLWRNPLDANAYTIHIPTMRANGTSVYCDPPVWFTLTIGSTVDGLVVEPGEGDFVYTNQTVVNINAMAEPGYSFVGWSGTAVDTGKVVDPAAANTTVTMMSDFTLWANFAINQDTRILTISSTSGGSVTIPGEGVYIYDQDTTLTITATPEAHYHLVNWTGSAVDVEGVTDPDASSTAVTMKGDYTLWANFRPIIYVDDNALADPCWFDPLISDPGENGSPEHPYDAIQEAIDTSASGDIIIVAPGIYTGDGNRDIDFKGKAITVKSEQGSRNCIVNCQGKYYVDGRGLRNFHDYEEEFHRGFHFYSGEDANSVVMGFTITNGYVLNYGGGIYCEASSPRIVDCIITKNLAQRDGGGISCGGSSPIITNCVITGNHAGDHGGGISCGGNIVIVNCNVFGNRASSGGGLCCRGGFGDHGLLANSIVFGNIAPTASEICLHCLSIIGAMDLDVSHSIIGSDPNAISALGGCISGEWLQVDPLFTQPGQWDPNSTPTYIDDDFWVEGDYHLKSQAGRWDPVSQSWIQDDVTSPCIDAGDPNSPVGDEPIPNGERINMGAYGGTAEASLSYIGAN